MRKIEFVKEFDAVTCLGSSFTYMQTHHDVLRALRGFYNSLRNDGILIFDCFDADDFKIERYNKWKEECQLIDDIKITCRTMNTDWVQSDSTWVTHWVWTVEDSTGIHEYSDVSKLKAYSYDYLVPILSEIGFKEIKRIKSRRLMILAKKPT